MKYVTAYLLATLGGNDQPSVDTVKKILASVQCEVEEEQMQKLFSELSGKNVNDLIREGLGKMASIPAASAAPTAQAKSGGSAAAKAEEQPKEEPKEESDEEMGFSLFD